MDDSKKRRLLLRAEHAEKSAASVKEPGVKSTLEAMAALYRDLAKQVDELEEIKARTRSLF
jgi:hypothetical protein